MELFKANRQWSTRPADERFTSIGAMHDAATQYAASAREKEGVRVDSIRVENIDGDVHIIGRGDVSAKLTHWAFGQLCNRIAAPASYLRDLPATLAAQNVNHGLAQRVKDAAESTVNLLFHLNGGYVLRALTSDRYERIWNKEVTARLIDLESQGWTPARPQMNIDPALMEANDPSTYSLYVSDHDMFAFIKNDTRTISEPGNPDGLQRGLIVENSEVGGAALKLTRFLYRTMCGNHIIWGASDVMEISARHVGNVRHKMALWSAEIIRYMDESASEDEAKIAASKRKLIAATKQEVLDALFGKRSIGLSRKALESGYDACDPDVDGDPRSPWGMAQGLTRYSQAQPYADKRTDIDRAAGRLLEAF
jgi:hypothetical protein